MGAASTACVFVCESVPSGLLPTVLVLALVEPLRVLVIFPVLARLLPPIKLQDLRKDESCSGSGWSTGTGLFQKVLWSLVLLLELVLVLLGGVVVAVLAVSGVVGVVRCFQKMLLLLLATGVRGILLLRCTSITDGVAPVILVVLTLVVAMVEGGFGGGDDPMRSALL
jgi:hypothetical protein